MCNSSCIHFAETYIKQNEVKGKSVLEVGSQNVNGSLRSFVTAFGPESYIGVDLEMGPGVDQVCTAENLLKKFGSNSFDVVISTEMVEHVKNWQKAVHNLKQVTKPGGLLLVTTRSEGFPLHGYPFDYWRFEIEDMDKIFSDFVIEKLEKDSIEPGVLLLARKPAHFQEIRLASHKLFSITLGRRTSALGIDIHFWREKLRLVLGFRLIKLLGRLKYYTRHPFQIPHMITKKFAKFFSN